MGIVGLITSIGGGGGILSGGFAGCGVPFGRGQCHAMSCGPGWGVLCQMQVLLSLCTYVSMVLCIALAYVRDLPGADTHEVSIALH